MSRAWLERMEMLIGLLTYKYSLPEILNPAMLYIFDVLWPDLSGHLLV